MISAISAAVAVLALLAKADVWTIPLAIFVPIGMLLCYRAVHGLSLMRPEPREPTLSEQPLCLIASMGVHACVVVNDEACRSFSALLRATFREEDLTQWFQAAAENTPWLQPLIQGGKPLPRKAAWFVRKGCKCCYGYGGVIWSPAETPEWLQEIEAAVWQTIHGSTGDQIPTPNSCVANLYADGSQSVDWHADDEPLFEGTSHDCCIVSLSLGASRRFDLRHRRGVGRQTVSIDLHDGDVVTMEGLFQKHWYHRVHRQKDPVGPRINLTWRTITAHSVADGCPFATTTAPEQVGPCSRECN